MDNICTIQAFTLWSIVFNMNITVLSMKVRERKSWLKAQHSENEDHGIRSHHFMGNRWGNSGNSVRLYFWGSKITADGDCSHEIKRCLLLQRKVMINLDSILKSRDITLPTKLDLVKAMVFIVSCMAWGSSSQLPPRPWAGGSFSRLLP